MLLFILINILWWFKGIFSFFFNKVISMLRWLVLNLFVNCLGDLKLYLFINVWIFKINVFESFKVIVIVFSFIGSFLEKNKFEVFLAFIKFCFFILNKLILFVGLKWFLKFFKIFNFLLGLSLKYSMLFIICFNILGFVMFSFLVIWLMIKIVIFFVLVKCMSLKVIFCICEIELGVEEIFGE